MGFEKYVKCLYTQTLTTLLVNVKLTHGHRQWLWLVFIFPVDTCINAGLSLYRPHDIWWSSPDRLHYPEPIHTHHDQSHSPSGILLKYTHSTCSNHLTAGKTNALFREPERVSYVPSAAPPGSPSARILDQNHLDLQTEKHTDHKEHFQHVFSLRQTRRTDKAAHNDSRFKILFITYTIIQNIISSEM